MGTKGAIRTLLDGGRQLLWIGCVFAVVLNDLVVTEKATADPGVSFSEDIRPIFTSHCTSCHGGVKKSGDLSFVYMDVVLSPDRGVVVAGDPAASLLIERVSEPDPDLRMPPAEHGPPLSAAEIALLRRWIRQGAPWAGHWSLTPPEASAPPHVANDAWPRNPLDRFVLARLEAEGIEPSPDETPERWLRRVSLDLTGLPPSLEELDDFLADDRQRGEPAYEAIVDRLLLSPHFGERWASVWLDQVRYADSRGLGFDNRRNAWQYRDWVIDAFNQDLPFDRFTTQQIAGDLLPDKSMQDVIASACHRLTQSNDEGGTDDEEFRVEAVLDRVNTTWQAWQGMTFGCVRCHDHPYEPFRHEEYYEFAAFFNNSRDSDLSEELPVADVPIDPACYKRASRLDAQIAKLQRQNWEDETERVNSAPWEALKQLTASSSTETRIETQQLTDHAEFHTAGTIANNTDITLASPLPTTMRRLTAIRLHCLPQDPEQALLDSEWGFVLSHVSAALKTAVGSTELSISRVIADEPDPFLDPQESLNPDSADGFSAYSRINHPRSAVLVLESPAEVPPGATLRVILQHRKQILASFSLITQRGYLEVSSDDGLCDLLTDSLLKERLAELGRLRAQRGEIASTALPVMQERPEHLSRPTHVFLRGSQLTKDQQVYADVPDAMPPLPKNASADRLGVAEWLVSPANPLTARVAVNRLWARMFGAGLVLTEEDFGSTGDPPSHPALLDYLACQYRGKLGWSTKKLLREIALSSTYRQSGVARPDLTDRDPNNRLLARGPRTSLSAEMVRDQALAVSGLLSEALAGPPVYPPIPAGVWRPFQAGDTWQTPEPGHPDRYRRSLYTYWKRSIPYPLSAAFDAPTREFCAPRRLRSNTPVQALMTLNGEDFQECAQALAQQMREADSRLSWQLRHGFRRVMNRDPHTAELDDLLAFVHRLPRDDTAEQRLTLAASVLLNLDEAITK